MIQSISLMPFMEFRALAQANNTVSSETVPDTSSETETDEEEDGFDAEFEDEFGDAEKEVFDPLSGYNIVMTNFNDGFYIFVLDPVARGYRWVLPYTVRRGVKSFFHNLLFPLRFVNNALQLKVKNAGEEFLRFSINSTIGILGFWDPAKEWFGLEAMKKILDRHLDFTVLEADSMWFYLFWVPRMYGTCSACIRICKWIL